MLEAINVSKTYQGKTVLRHMNIQVKQGEMVGLIGPNGSGKTTLVRLLSGDEEPDSGKVRLQGKEYRKWSPRERARQLAVLSQDGLPSIPFTVREVVTMGRHPHQGPWPWAGGKDREVVERVLAQTSLKELEHKPVHLLSGGERQRVAIAKAMAQQPRFLILDEPTTYLDISHQVRILDRIQSWQRKEGLGVLLVLHDLNLAAQYCDRLVLISQSETVIQGFPAEVITAPLIYQAYGIRPVIVPHPVNHVPQVLLQTEEEGWAKEDGKQVTPLPLQNSSPITGKEKSNALIYTNR